MKTTGVLTIACALILVVGTLANAGDNRAQTQHSPYAVIRDIPHPDPHVPLICLDSFPEPAAHHVRRTFEDPECRPGDRDIRP